jgi:hypothetical protein
MSDAFACGCSDESRATSERWLRQVMPGMDPGEETILTGEQSHYRYEDQNGKVYEGDRDEHRHADLTESMIIGLAEEAEGRSASVEFGVAIDQWCGLYVTEKKWKPAGGEERGVGVEYDYGLLPHALAAATLLLRGEEVYNAEEREAQERRRAGNKPKVSSGGAADNKAEAADQEAGERSDAGS